MLLLFIPKIHLVTDLSIKLEMSYCLIKFCQYITNGSKMDDFVYNIMTYAFCYIKNHMLRLKLKFHSIYFGKTDYVIA